MRKSSNIFYGKHRVCQDDIQAVSEVLESDWLTQGPNVRNFEENVAKYLGVKYAVAACNGTATLHLAYLAAGIKTGDEVITTPNTFVATSNMLMLIGAKPVFCDIRLDTYNIDETKIEELITPKTKAIAVVHFAGQPCEMDTIIKIANKYGLRIIEDAAHALGAEYKGKKIGSLDSDMTSFSFHPVKPITTGEGGMIVTNNKKYYKRLLSLRSHGIEKDENGFNVMTELGFNYRITDFQCALGSSQLKRLDDFLEKRHQVVKWYYEELQDFGEIILPVELEENFSGWHLFMIRVKNKAKRILLYKFLQENNIFANFHYPCVYRHPYYQENGFENVKCENAEQYADEMITLPIHTQINREDIIFISKTIKNFYE